MSTSPTPITTATNNRNSPEAIRKQKATHKARFAARQDAERRALQDAMARWEQTGVRQIVRLPLGKLRIDHTYYQRDLDEAFVRKITKDFDARLLGELEVNIRPDGGIYVIDGQHRMSALARTVRNPDLFTVPCIINTVPTVEEEARLYMARNFYIRPASRSSTFQSRITLSDERAIAVRDLILKYGYQVWTANVRHTVPAGWINAGAAEYIARQYSLDRLESVLATISTVYGMSQGFQTKFLTGLAMFLNRSADDPNFRFDRLYDVLRRNPPEVILTTGANKKTMHHVTNQTGVALALFAAYNYGLQRKLATWTV